MGGPSPNTLPSPWVLRFAPLVREGGSVLDIACGTGRHAAHFVARGHRVTALDQDISGLPPKHKLEALEADLEDGSAWPLPGRTFDGIVVCNYLFRPLFPVLLNSLSASGVLIYETFATGNEKFGKPKNSDFLLQRGELLDVFGKTLDIIAYEFGTVHSPAPAAVQRVVAVRPNYTRGATLYPVLPPLY